MYIDLVENSIRTLQVGCFDLIHFAAELNVTTKNVLKMKTGTDEYIFVS